jgi:hypothetical protein
MEKPNAALDEHSSGAIRIGDHSEALRGRFGRQNRRIFAIDDLNANAFHRRSSPFDDNLGVGRPPSIMADSVH